MQSIQPEIMRNFDFYNKATWQEVKPQIRTFIELFQKQQQISIQNIEQFYQNLEYDHSFIQWLFPNFYSSRFNSNCYKLTLVERYQMINSETILERYYKNYIMILRFFGIGLKQVVIMDTQIDDSIKSNTINQQSQQQKQIIKIQESKDTQEKNNQINSKIFPQKTNYIQIEKQQYLKQKTQQNIRGINQLQQLQQQFQQPKDTNTLNNIQIKNKSIDQIEINYKLELILIDKNQFELCFLKNTHNLLRLKRILASLSVLKHRQDAIQLCQFLKRELINLGSFKIYEEYFSGYDRYYEEILGIESNRDKNRNFDSYKFCYVDKDLVEKIDISLIQ
ncbi:unnamed protein product [Paramecium primaurelia]|uniref:Opioid growth factor receptor (OGFr) conserved domain-containing protein n=1 Tax=Paramecium primaurelia TaxID=5886 RepID=A0A8S1N1Q8_PARPR|nr:unnamed protein product [Paramecium primaurelia]